VSALLWQLDKQRGAVAEHQVRRAGVCFVVWHPLSWQRCVPCAGVQNACLEFWAGVCALCGVPRIRAEARRVLREPRPFFLQQELWWVMKRLMLWQRPQQGATGLHNSCVGCSNRSADASAYRVVLVWWPAGVGWESLARIRRAAGKLCVILHAVQR
jgi:hypothetical protein